MGTEDDTEKEKGDVAMSRNYNARRRPGDRGDALAITKRYLSELHEVADSLTRDDRKLSRLSMLAAKHGINLGIKRDCLGLCRLAKHLKAAIRKLTRSVT